LENKVKKNTMNLTKEYLKITLRWYSTHDHEGCSNEQDKVVASQIEKFLEETEGFCECGKTSDKLACGCCFDCKCETEEYLNQRKKS
jgi:hypothetical protein